MRGRRKKSRLHRAGATLWIQKKQTIEEFDFAGGADAPVKIFEVGAAAEGDMLTIVHALAIRQRVGSRAAAEIGALLKESYAAACVSQRDAGRQPRQPTANHDHVFRGHYPVYAAQSVRGR
nr:hypothetical protein Hi04_10k_c5216_00034 [uncultured bacterium]